MSNKEKNTYAFEDKKFLVGLFNKLLKNPTQVKVQKSMYLAYAYYSAMVKSNNYPKELFNANFIAEDYGVIDIDIFNYYKEDIDFSVSDKEIDNFFCELGENIQTNIYHFIMDVVNATNSIDDFSLIIRTKQDMCYKIAYNREDKRIFNKDIKKEYCKDYPNLCF